MSTGEEHAFGERWILDRVHAVAAQVGLLVDSAQWARDAEDLKRTPRTTHLVVVAGGRRFDETFTVAELEAVAHDHAARYAVLARIQVLIARAAEATANLG